MSARGLYDATLRRAGGAGSLLAAITWAEFALGVWLAWVPDRLAFTVSQAVVLAHVSFGVVTVPLVALTLWTHTRRPRLARASTGHGLARMAGRVIAVVTLLVAIVTGLWVTASGAVSAVAWWHRVAGLSMALPLMIHAAIEGRRALTRGLGLGLGAVVAVSASLGLLASRLRPPDPPVTFRWRQVAQSGYDEAAWCGECHGDIYNEWRQSAHARTLELPKLRENFSQEENLHQRTRDLGDVAAGVERSEHWEPLAPLDVCRGCHTPTSFYARDRRAVLEATGVAREGVTCSFCHSIRGTRPFARRTPALDRNLTTILEGGVRETSALFAYFTSRPDLVSRYAGQASAFAPLRALGNFIIRWRPAQHRADYHSPFMARSEVCVGCHGGSGDYPESPFKTYYAWLDSDFATRPNATTCQDCHMALEPGRRPAAVPGRILNDGPMRPRRRVHLFLGGNAEFHATLGNPAMALRERRFAAAAHTLDVQEARLQGDRLALTVSVGAPGVGHDYPAMETSSRYAWIEARALDAEGRVVWTSPRGPELTPIQAQWDAPLLYREVDQHRLVVTRDEVVHAGGARTVSWAWTLPAPSSVVALEVSLHGRFSQGALVTTSLRRDADGRFVPSARGGDPQAPRALIGSAHASP